MDITRTSGKRGNAGQRELVTAESNHSPGGKLWKALPAVVFGLLSVAGLAQAQQAQYTFITIDVLLLGPTGAPTPAPTTANGNSTHQIVGQFGGDDNKQHGFVLNRADVGARDPSVFTHIDFSGASATSLTGINAAGKLTGNCEIPDTNSNTATNHAFVGENGHFTTLDPPGASRSQTGFINAQGQVVGAFRDLNANQKRLGFIWRKGTFTIFNVPGDSTPPDGFGTVPQGINDIGQVVGDYTAQNDPVIHGFLRSSKGEFTNPIDFPGKNTIVTVAFGINNAGTIVGVYVDDTGQHGFVRSSEGEFAKVDFKDENGDAHPTEIDSINAKGEIVGYYLDVHDVQHGFLGTPIR